MRVIWLGGSELTSGDAWELSMLEMPPHAVFFFELHDFERGRDGVVASAEFTAPELRRLATTLQAKVGGLRVIGGSEPA